MFKTPLHSKIFQIDPAWRDIEDILTGDFFGALDYLPRQPYLKDFLRRLHANNQATMELEGVDWEGVEFRFWQMTHAQDETAEPDLILLSNQWVLVVEVKLNSGLGKRQPWREFSRKRAAWR